MNKSNISKVINKMKMFLPLSMLWIGAVTSGYLSDIDLQSEATATSSDKQKKAPSFFSLFDIFSICCQPTTDKDDLDDKIKKELPRVNPSPLLHLGYLLKESESNLYKQKKAPSFFSLFDIFSICCQPTTDKDDLDDKIKKELPLVNPSPLLHLGHLPKESKSNELRDFKQNRSYQGDNGL